MLSLALEVPKVPLTWPYVAGTVGGVSTVHQKSPEPGRELSKRPSRDARSAPGRADSSQGAENRWRTIRYALGSNARTVRLCVIMFVAGIPADVFMLARH